MEVKIGPYSEDVDTEERIKEIRIDEYDIWSMDSTIACIIVPMLEKLKEVGHGYPQSLSCMEDWHVILDEMIWSFSEASAGYPTDNYFVPYDKEEDVTDHRREIGKLDREKMYKYEARLKRGFNLFGLHYMDLWD